MRIHNKIFKSFPLVQNKTDVIFQRKPCGVCSTNPKSCQVISSIFARKHKTEGYMYMATIPSGACGASVKQLGDTNNFLALRWNSSDSSYFLNGNWIIQKSGNYTLKTMSFSYATPGMKTDFSSAKEQIRFETQLTRPVEACLISQSKNRGVAISYSLPPFYTAGEEPGQNAVVANVNVATKTTRSTKREDEKDDETQEKEEEQRPMVNMLNMTRTIFLLFGKSLHR